jgi:hypothetical protein
MKRDEIEVGKEYLVGTHHTWATDHYRNAYVRVIDTSHGWTKSRSLVAPQGQRMRETDSGPLEVPYGFVDGGHLRGVLVQVLDRGTDQFAVYDPKYFRVTKAEGERIIAEHRDKERLRQERAFSARAERRARMEDLQARAKDVGLTVVGDGMDMSVKIKVEEFERLLKLLEGLPGLREGQRP